MMPGLAPVASTPSVHSCHYQSGARPCDAPRAPGEPAVGPRSMTEPRTSRYVPAAHDQSPHSTARIAAGLRAVIKASSRRWLPSALRLSPDALPPILYVYTSSFLG